MSWQREYVYVEGQSPGGQERGRKKIAGPLRAHQEGNCYCGDGPMALKFLVFGYIQFFRNLHSADQGQRKQSNALMQIWASQDCCRRGHKWICGEESHPFLLSVGTSPCYSCHDGKPSYSESWFFSEKPFYQHQKWHPFIIERRHIQVLKPKCKQDCFNVTLAKTGWILL